MVMEKPCFQRSTASFSKVAIGDGNDGGNISIQIVAMALLQFAGINVNIRPID